MFIITLYVKIVKIAIWDDWLDFVYWSWMGGGDYGGQGGLALYVVTRGG